MLAATCSLVFLFGLVGPLAHRRPRSRVLRAPGHAHAVAAAIVAWSMDIVLALTLSSASGCSASRPRSRWARGSRRGSWSSCSPGAVPALGLGRVGRIALLTIAATIPATIVAWFVEQALLDRWGTYPGFLTVLIRLLIVGAAGGIVLLAGSLALRIPELPAMLSLMTDLVRRRRAPAA